MPYIITDNDNIVHGSGATVDAAWEDAEYTFRAAGIVLLSDNDDSTEQQGAWTRRSGLTTRSASDALIAEIERAGGNLPWRMVGGVAVTAAEAGE